MRAFRKDVPLMAAPASAAESTEPWDRARFLERLAVQIPFARI
jgi:hypothetical protein